MTGPVSPAARPGGNQPGTTRAGAAQPGTTQKGGNQPGTTQKGGNQPGTTRAGAAWLADLAAGAAALGMLSLPAVTGSGPARVLAAAGLVLVAASLAGPLRGWRGGGALAAVAAVLACAIARPGGLILAGDGLLILAYLLLLDAPVNPRGPAMSRWLRQQIPAAACGTAGAAAVLLLLTVPVPASAWLVVGGVAAAVAATATALPRRPRSR